MLTFHLKELLTIKMKTVIVLFKKHVTGARLSNVAHPSLMDTMLDTLKWLLQGHDHVTY